MIMDTPDEPGLLIELGHEIDCVFWRRRDNDRCDCSALDAFYETLTEKEDDRVPSHPEND